MCLFGRNSEVSGKKQYFENISFKHRLFFYPIPNDSIFNCLSSLFSTNYKNKYVNTRYIFFSKWCLYLTYVCTCLHCFHLMRTRQWEQHSPADAYHKNHSQLRIHDQSWESIGISICLLLKITCGSELNLYLKQVHDFQSYYLS